MLKFKLLTTGFLTMILGAGIAVGVVANDYTPSVEVDAAAAVDGSMTRLTITDELNWNFRSLCLSGFKFADGYDYHDLERYLTLNGGTELAINSIKEGTTKGYYKSNLSSSSGYMYVNGGGSSKTRSYDLPGWLLDYKIEVANNGNTWSVGNLSSTMVHSQYGTNKNQGNNDNGCGKVVTIKPGSHWGINQSVYCGVGSDVAKTDTRTVTLKHLTGSTEVTSDKTVSCYTYYKPAVGTPTAVADYANDGKWYTNNSFSSVYSSQIIGTANLVLYASYQEILYTVTEYDVFDGIIDSSSVRTSNQGKKYTPVQATLDGYFSKGIYKDAEGTTLFDNTISENITLYHIYETKQYGYVYLSSFNDDWYIDASNKGTTTFSLYSFDSATTTPTNGEWPGTALNLGELSSVGINFDTKGGLIRVPILLNGNVPTDKFVIASTKPQTQSADLTVTIGAYYDINKLFQGTDSDVAGDATLGEQAALAFDIEAAMQSAGSHTYKDKTYTKSLCAIDRAEALVFIDRYNALSSNTAFNKTTFWTNNVDGRKDGSNNIQTNGDYTGLEVITSLRTLHVDSASELRMILSNASESPVMLITIIATISAVSFVMIIVIKRRKQSSK